ncbi:MAG: hypothetical protein KJN76_10150, partial [Eudoraea sp.]|nr:hypothetical protein [Eudoraea sp.]
MKNLITACVLLLGFVVSAQNLQLTTSPDSNEYASAYEVDNSDIVNTKASEVLAREEFLKAAKYNDIPTRQFTDLSGINNGFYLITGVYSKDKNAKKHIRKLKKKQVEAAYFTHPETNLRYVFL